MTRGSVEAGSAAPVSAAEARPDPHRIDLLATAGWLGAFLLVSLIVGGASGAVWSRLVDLPGYTVADDFSARMSEAGHAQVIEADLWLAGLGVVVGLALGWLGWHWFARLGWLCPVVATLAALLAARVAVAVGGWLGPGDLDQRLANAQPSPITLIAIPLAPHSPVYLAVWAAFALLPVTVAAARTQAGSRLTSGRRLEIDDGAEPTSPRPVRRRRAAEQADGL